MNARGGGTGSLHLARTSIYIGRNLLCTYPAVAGALEFAPSFPGFDVSRIASIQARLNLIFENADVGPAEPPLPAPAGSGPRETGAHLVAWLTCALQNFAGANVREFGVARGADGAIHALSAYQSPGFARNAMRLACRVVAALPGDAADLDRHTIATPVSRAIGNLMRLRERAHVDHHTADVLAAARARGIPCHFLPVARIVQLGDGARQRLIRGTMDDRTSHVASLLCHDKLAAAEVLKRLGLPTTSPVRVDNVRAAENLAERLGYPVVIKPALGNEGKGITVDVMRRDEVAPAFRKAREADLGPVLIEKFADGDDHRLLVVEGRLVAAAKRVPAHVIGDGRHSVEALIGIANRDPRRGVGHQSRLMERLVYDEEMARFLARRGYVLDAVPPAGETVWLRGTANISTGGTAWEATDMVHPEIRGMAELAARAFRANVLGVDYLTTDISRSPQEVPGVICEVNEGPGLRPHWLAGTSRERYLGPLLERLFRDGEMGRIPIVAIAGGPGASAVAAMVAAMLAASGVTTGLAGSDGVTVAGRRIRSGDATGGEAARLLLIDPDTQAAVMELSDASLRQSGLPFDRCDVAAVISAHADIATGAASNGNTVRPHALVAASATRAVVLDACDPHLDALVITAPEVCLVSRSATDPRVKAHLCAGGSACVLSGEGPEAELVMLAGAGNRVALCRLRDVAAAGGGVTRAAADVLFAAAIGGQLGLAAGQIRAGLVR